MYALGRSGTRRAINIWPGFVDGLASLLLVVIFVLMVFMVAQFFLSAALVGRDEALEKLRTEVSELADLLSLERSANQELRINVAELSSQLQNSLSDRESLTSRLLQLGEERDRIAALLEQAEERASRAEDRLAASDADLDDERARLEEALARMEVDQQRLQEALAKIAADKEQLEAAYQTIQADKETIDTQLAELAILKSMRDELLSRLAETEGSLQEQESLTEEANAAVALLNRQIFALREQLKGLETLLREVEEDNKAKDVQIADLGKRLNVALASKVQELARYRSEFFGRLREALGDRQDIRVVGDRFVFQSEVLFASGSADLGLEGQRQLGELARTLRDISAGIPDDIDWVLRVDGHTDRNPISTPLFPSNWELSTARAISVVKFLITRQIPADRLAATGFGEFQPLDRGNDEIAFRRNRRIELKLTQR